jgi:NitT/TauT family transport system substrate-binding protein
MRPTTIGATLAITLAGTLLAACGGGASSSTTSATGSEPAASAATESAAEGSGEVTPLILGAVPSLDLGLIEVAKEQGLFEQAGVSVEIVPVDSGPNVVTGVVAGQYDIGSTAYAPPLLALAEGAPLTLVSSVGTVGPDGSNGGLLVKQDSGIATWKDLAGKKIASNAPRSLFSLTVPAAITADGGDASGIEIVPLPFNQIPKAVADGQVDAGVVLEPFLTAGLAEYPDLVNLGDSIHAVLPEGSGSGLYFTSADTDEAKGPAIQAFQQAIAEAIVYANENLDEVKAAGAPQAGLTAEQAAALPLTAFQSEIAEADLQELLALMVKFGWITEAPDLSTFLK